MWPWEVTSYSLLSLLLSKSWNNTRPSHQGLEHELSLIKVNSHWSTWDPSRVFPHIRLSLSINRTSPYRAGGQGCSLPGCSPPICTHHFANKHSEEHGRAQGTDSSEFKLTFRKAVPKICTTRGMKWFPQKKNKVRLFSTPAWDQEVCSRLLCEGQKHILVTH